MATADEESGPHAELSLPGGFTLELDTVESAGLWHAGVRADPASGRVVIGFSLPSREAVDAAYAELTAAGYQGRQPPFDAFWGGRYAIVADPGGNDVGLMSPIDESMRTLAPGRVARMTRVQRFTARVDVGPRGRGIIAVPFDPDEAWGAKSEHLVGGTIDGRKVRGTVAPGDRGWVFTLTSMWMCDADVSSRHGRDRRACTRKARSAAISPKTSPPR